MRGKGLKGRGEVIVWAWRKNGRKEQTYDMRQAEGKMVE
jgi:hypothetical protein